MKTFCRRRPTDVTLNAPKRQHSMLFDLSRLLAPISEVLPCGEPLSSLEGSEELRALVNTSQRPDWARHMPRAVALAEASRDLRAWVWLARAALCAEGVRGLAAGLQLIADGLERYWEILPPQHEDETDPRERFMGRLSALTQLGTTNFAYGRDQLFGHGRVLTDLRADLDAMAAKAAADPTTRQAIDDARGAIARIVAIF